MGDPAQDDARGDWDLFAVVVSGHADRHAACSVLYTRHYAKVRSYCGLQLRDWHLADDAAQDVFTRLTTMTDFYPGAPFGAFLIAIAARVVQEYWGESARSRIGRAMQTEEAAQLLNKSDGVWTLTELGQAKANALRRAQERTGGKTRRLVQENRRTLLDAVMLALAYAGEPISIEAILQIVQDYGLDQTARGRGTRQLEPMDIESLAAPVNREATDRFYTRAIEEVSDGLRGKRVKDHLAFHLAVCRRRWANAAPTQRPHVLAEGRSSAGSQVFGRYLWLRRWSATPGPCAVRS